MSGLLGLFMLAGLFYLPNLLAPSLSAKEAEKWIRRHLKEEITLSRIERFKESENGRKAKKEAENLQIELKKLETVPFKSVEVGHFLFPPPGSSTRIYVVKVVIGDGSQGVPRFFSLSAENNMFDFFWVNEHSRWMWFFSI
ncbi:hypothetical protein GWN15_23585 [candidate division KSB1 bacterium]|nr:hypothetical protein [candidate division KSB1 bacterium]